MQFNNPIRTRQYNEIKTKTKEISFSTLTQEVLQANYLVHSMNKDIQKCDPCLCVTHVYLVGNVNKKLELSSLCGMNVISCLSQ